VPRPANEPGKGGFWTLDEDYIHTQALAKQQTQQLYQATMRARQHQNPPSHHNQHEHPHTMTGSTSNNSSSRRQQQQLDHDEEQHNAGANVASSSFFSSPHPSNSPAAMKANASDPLLAAALLEPLPKFGPTSTATTETSASDPNGQISEAVIDEVSNRKRQAAPKATNSSSAIGTRRKSTRSRTPSTPQVEDDSSMARTEKTLAATDILLSQFLKVPETQAKRGSDEDALSDDDKDPENHNHGVHNDSLASGRKASSRIRSSPRSFHYHAYYYPDQAEPDGPSAAAKKNPMQ
jgi:hypothetical protein